MRTLIAALLVTSTVWAQGAQAPSKATPQQGAQAPSKTAPQQGAQAPSKTAPQQGAQAPSKAAPELGAQAPSKTAPQQGPQQGPPPKNLTVRPDGHVSANQDPTNPEKFEIHVVVKGETLSGIAGEFLK